MDFLLFQISEVDKIRQKTLIKVHSMKEKLLSEFLIQGFIATLNTPYTLLIAGRREIPHLADLCRFSMCQWYIMTLCTF